MLRYNDYIENHRDLKQGMDAYTVDGNKLGTIVELNDDSLIIEKGFFFPRDYSFRYDDISQISDSKVIINQKKSDVDAWKNKDYAGWKEYDRLNTEENVSIPVREEKLEAEKVIRQKGEVHVRKVVHTEMKNFTIPVSKEEVIVERKPVDKEGVPAGTTAFKEEEINIPVMEEETKVVKKPVVKEEVNIKKKVTTEREKVSGEVKSEEVHIDRDEDKDRRKAA